MGVIVNIEFGVGASVTDAAPPAATSAAGTIAVSCVEFTNVVASATPFQYTVLVEENPVPFIVSVNCAEPAATEEGESDVMVGCPKFPPAHIEAPCEDESGSP